jgi:hypothetical protein
MRHASCVQCGVRFAVHAQLSESAFYVSCASALRSLPKITSCPLFPEDRVYSSSDPRLCLELPSASGHPRFTYLCSFFVQMHCVAHLMV